MRERSLEFNLFGKPQILDVLLAPPFLAYFSVLPMHWSWPDHCLLWNRVVHWWLLNLIYVKLSFMMNFNWNNHLLGLLRHMFTKDRTRALGQWLIQGRSSEEIYQGRDMDMIYVAAMVQGILEVHTYAHLHSVQYFAFNNIKKRIKFKHLPLHCPKFGLFSSTKKY